MWLKYYSGVFDFVEIDSSFYKIPSQFMVKNWYNKTPENFRFAAKFPKIITHDKRLKNLDEEQLDYFFDSMSELKEKLLTLLIQLPPSMQIVEGLDALGNIIPQLDNSFRYAVEVRHRSWFQDLAYNFFSNNNICLVWSQLSDIRTPPIITSDFIYIRFIGDRSIQEKDFGQIQLDRIKEMQKVIRNLKRETNETNLTDVRLAIVAANNHYAGFGPGTVNIFRQLLGMKEIRWGDAAIEEGRILSSVQNENLDTYNSTNKQTTLSDFPTNDDSKTS
jgi:uncharacterized protein YecE (DUF72 family)